MLVNLKCIYGDLSPYDNPHNVKDEVAEKLINDGLAEETKKRVSANKEVEELKLSLEAKDEEIEALKEIVIETSKLSKDKLPESFKKYQG